MKNTLHFLLKTMIVSILFFTTMLNVASAAPSLTVSSIDDYKQVTLNYTLEGTRKKPDRYVIKRDSSVIAEVTTLQYVDTGLNSNTLYSYTIEAWLKNTLLASNNYNTKTSAIPVTDISVVTDVQADHTVQLSWNHIEPTFAPDRYKVLHGTEVLYEGTNKDFTTLPLTAGTYTFNVEAWYENELVGSGSQTFTIPEIEVATINANATLNLDYSATVDYNLIDPQMPPDRFAVYLDGSKIYDGMPTDTTIQFPNLNPGQTYTVKIEAYNQNRLIGQGDCTFTAPYPVDITYEVSSWNPETNEHSINILFNWDQTLQNADRMVIVRLDETQIPSILYDGVPIQSFDDMFSPEHTEYSYFVANYQNGQLVGQGYLKIANFFYY